jgi:hypothetical protein
LRSRTTARFRVAFEALPDEVQRRAWTAFVLWQENALHPSLRFKQVHATQPIYSVRVGLGWRALGLRDGDAMIWFWIGSHADYDHLLETL